jgi:hypothetical protein
LRLRYAHIHPEFLLMVLSLARSGQTVVCHGLLGARNFITGSVIYLHSYFPHWILDGFAKALLASRHGGHAIGLDL